MNQDGAERLNVGSRRYSAKETSSVRRRLIPKTEIRPNLGNSSIPGSLLRMHGTEVSLLSHIGNRVPNHDCEE